MAVRNIGALLGALNLLLFTVNAHTWIEQYQVIGPNGSYIGDNGYSRGYVARTDPTFQGDGNILWMLPELSAREPNGDVRLRINSSDLLCHPNQRTSNYSNPAYPKLKVAPGNYVAMRYYENGHVTLPWNTAGKPDMGGTAFVFGTTNPLPDEKLSEVMKWTADGKGGDGRGVLLAAQNFDDGRCHQINSCVLSAERQVLFPNHVPGTNTSAELWCETDLLVPASQKPGSTLTTYWVWQWPTEPGTSCVYADGKDEYYTTCADFDIVAPSPGEEKIAAEPVTNTLLQQDFQSQAVSTFASRTALTTTASATLNEWATFSAQLAATDSLPASFVSSCSAEAQAAAAAVKAGQTPAPPPSCPADKWATGAAGARISASAEEEKDAQATASLQAPVTATGSGSVSTSGVVASGVGVSSAVDDVATSVAAPVSSVALSTPPPTSLPAGVSASVSMWTVTELRTVTAPASGAGSTAVPTVVENAAAVSMSEHCATMRRHARQFR